MSKTGAWVINCVETISKKTGYSFKLLLEKYFDIIDEIAHDGERADESPLATLEERAFAKAYEQPTEKPFEGGGGAKFIVGNIGKEIVLTLPRLETETERIRKHVHDTLFAASSGFVAAIVLMGAMALIVLGILDFARGI